MVSFVFLGDLEVPRGRKFISHSLCTLLHCCTNYLPSLLKKKRSSEQKIPNHSSDFNCSASSSTSTDGRAACTILVQPSLYYELLHTTFSIAPHPSFCLQEKWSPIATSRYSVFSSFSTCYFTPAFLLLTLHFSCLLGWVFFFLVLPTKIPLLLPSPHSQSPVFGFHTLPVDLVRLHETSLFHSC